MDISDLTNEIVHGRTMVETATFLCRDEDEVRQKAKELGSRRRCIMCIAQLIAVVQVIAE
jgi:hypothetical protein